MTVDRKNWFATTKGIRPRKFPSPSYARQIFSLYSMNGRKIWDTNGEKCATVIDLIGLNKGAVLYSLLYTAMDSIRKRSASLQQTTIVSGTDYTRLFNSNWLQMVPPCPETWRCDCFHNECNTLYILSNSPRYTRS